MIAIQRGEDLVKLYLCDGEVPAINEISTTIFCWNE